MNTPIIDPSTLTEEQREIIKAKYKEVVRFGILDKMAVLIWLFGKEFFEKGE